MIIKWFIRLFKCKHEKKIFLYSMPDYVDPHCRLIGYINHLKCSTCGEYIKEHERYL